MTTEIDELCLPDAEKTPLRLSAAAVMVLYDLFRREEREFLPVSARECVALLWIASRDRKVWARPTVGDDGETVPPLYLRPFDLMDEVNRWFSDTFKPGQLNELMLLAAKVWNRVNQPANA